ncbi:glucosaminidase domain-containing protein [Clostridium perfringens]|uniref:glucosaminidase domain-containing protein n=1 Tax=Clostridium perfringens TaxID=1502 RepID=UPI001242DC82|nr:glucosaminidase domain-containing protein [Clostridium perfringens]MDU7726914.1 glucosaminidase domain-containing protein [Clostridium perfringens]HAT4120427.1 glucosaminidase domain-containing protein [Clostridium perfringens]
MKEDQFNIETLIVAILVMLTIINIDVVHVTEAQSVKIEIETEEDIPIVSDVFITVDDAKKWAQGKGATKEFVELADLYWEYSDEHGDVNPALAYVQAAKETAYGNFGGVLDASYHNPCGLKTNKGGSDKDPKAHMKFKSWNEGVKAHLDHLALYAGAEGYPKAETKDPRHFASIFGKANSAIDLSKNWAPSPTYGEEILGMYNEMMEGAGNKDIEVMNIF